jgi:hypothetical protein
MRGLSPKKSEVFPHRPPAATLRTWPCSPLVSALTMAEDTEGIDPFAGLRRLTKVKEAHLQQSQVVLAALTEVIGEDPSPIAYFGALMTALQQQAQQDPAEAADSSLSPMLYLLGCVFPHVPSSYVCQSGRKGDWAAGGGWRESRTNSMGSVFIASRRKGIGETSERCLV